MKMENTLPCRKPLRADFHDYSGGDYFVTICTQGKRHYFGEIFNGTMHLNAIGVFVDNEMERLPRHYRYVEVPLWVVMPNHVHAVIRICGNDAADNLSHAQCCRQALGVVVGGMKRAVTIFAKSNGFEFGWQGRFHDHIIRGTYDGNLIADYIRHNVVRWDTDCYNT